MKKFNYGSIILTILLMVFTFSTTRAQPSTPPPPQEVDLDQPPSPRRANLLRELGLSPVQIRQIRRLNQETRPQMQESQRRLRDANFRLDQAIYADAENDPEVQDRLREVHAAQLEVLKNRTRVEIAIRRILTPEQLNKFRTLRHEFAASANRGSPGGGRINPRRQQRQNKLRNLPKALRPGAARPPRPVQ